MAKSFGGFYFDEEVFTGMMNEAQYWNNPIIASGVVREDASIMNAIGENGNVATLPFYAPLNVNDTGMAPINNDGSSDNTPVAIAGGKQTCMLIQRMKAFKSNDFTRELTGADPIDHVAKSVQNYYAQVWERELMNIAAAVMGVADLSDHVTDLSIVTGTIGTTNKINETTIIDAEQKALGDMAGGMGLVVMHSKIYAAFKKLGLVEYDKYVTQGAIKQDLELPTINGKHVLVTDYYTLDSTVSGYPVYSTYLLGEGAFLSATKQNYKNAYYTDYDPETDAGVEKLYTKQGKVLHPNGMSLDITSIAGESPTYQELGTAGNYDLAFNHKNVKIGVIKTNG